MRHGWKNRIDERRYFENKRQEREERQQVMALIHAKMKQAFEDEMRELEKEQGVH